MQELEILLEPSNGDKTLGNIEEIKEEETIGLGIENNEEEIVDVDTENFEEQIITMSVEESQEMATDLESEPPLPDSIVEHDPTVPQHVKGITEEDIKRWNEGSEVDTSAFYTKDEIDNKGYLTSVPSEYVTDKELNSKGYLTSIPREYVTETELNNKGYIKTIPSEYITEMELNSKGYLTSIPNDVVRDTNYIHTDNNYTTTEKNKLKGIEANANNYVLPSDVVKDNKYVHTDNNYTSSEKSKLSSIEANANNYVLPNDVVQDADYVHTDNNFTDADKEKLDNLESLSGKASDISYEDNYGYGGTNVQDALDKAFANIDNGFMAYDIGYEDNMGYEVDNVQDALDKAFDTLDNKMNYQDFRDDFDQTIGDIQELETTDTSNIVNAINDVNSELKSLPTIAPFIPQTRISQLIMDDVKYLKIEWNNNPSFLRYQNLGFASLYLYKYTKSGRKHWVRDQREITHSGVKKWVHPANGFTAKTNHQCWGIRSFDANPMFTENYSVDDIISDAEYPIANNGYVKTEYPLEVDQTSVLIPLNDIVSPILKVAHIGTDALVLPSEGDGLELKLMGVKQNKNRGRCNQPIKFCLAVGSTSNLYVGSCLNVATIQLFKYRVTRDNHSMHGYDTRYSVLPDVGYSVYIK